LRSRLLNNWGTCELARGRYAAAAGCFARAVELDTITHGANHGFVAMSLLHLAEAQLAERDVRAAAVTLERAVHVCQPDRLAPTPTRLRCLGLVGRLRLAEGDPAAAVGPLERAVAGWERMIGRERALGETLRDLANAQGALGDPRADELANRAERLLSIAPPRTA
jgi:tetratricopeptide (TPR) repeat protein